MFEIHFHLALYFPVSIINTHKLIDYVSVRSLVFKTDHWINTPNLSNHLLVKSLTIKLVEFICKLPTLVPYIFD